MEENIIRKIFYYKNYYLDFYETLNDKAKLKFNWTLKLIATIQRIPVKYFKHVEGSSGIYEIRVEIESNIYRVFSFFDDGKLIILINGFQKKSKRTPNKEIKKAEKIKKLYFDEK